MSTLPSPGLRYLGLFLTAGTTGLVMGTYCSGVTMDDDDYIIIIIT